MDALTLHGPRRQCVKIWKARILVSQLMTGGVSGVSEEKRSKAVARTASFEDGEPLNTSELKKNANLDVMEEDPLVSVVELGNTVGYGNVDFFHNNSQYDPVLFCEVGQNLGFNAQLDSGPDLRLSGEKGG